MDGVMGVCSSLCRSYYIIIWLYVLNTAGSTARHTSPGPGSCWDWVEYLPWLWPSSWSDWRSSKLWRSLQRVARIPQWRQWMQSRCSTVYSICEGGGRGEGKERRGERRERKNRWREVERGGRWRESDIQAVTAWSVLHSQHSLSHYEQKYTSKHCM